MKFNLWIIFFVAVLAGIIESVDGGGWGRWDLLQSSVGITAMHMQLLPNDRIVILDRTDFGKSNISLPNGNCRRDWKDKALKVDCTAHSVEYDVVTNSVRPLYVMTDVWCSSGSLMSDGRLVQTGGFNDGDHAVRTIRPCLNCDWTETSTELINRRWYSTNHILPDGRQIIIGGRRQFNYEFYPKTPSSSSAYNLPFLVQTNDPKEENNLYPFVFLNVDGNLFIFANNRAILFDYTKRVVVKNYPQIPGGDPRCYPSTGSAVLLPIKNSAQAEVLICGGARRGSYTSAIKGQFGVALNTCARIRITDPNPMWVMETMPLARLMGDMVLLPNADVLIINGASKGSAGWEFGRSPVLNPVTYRPDNPYGSRFEIQNPSVIPRMYHSTAILLRDSRVVVGGSNPHEKYNFTSTLFPTELSLEAFSPSYLDPQFASTRPTIISPVNQIKLRHGQSISIRFKVTGPIFDALVSVTMVAPSFNTHSFSMNQRLLVLKNIGKVIHNGASMYLLTVSAPDSSKLAPPGYYLLFVVHKSVPSEGIWVHIE
ncbi:aldehyde oxidase GLOX-like [Impatiens glandulifera]|uniref:aldehyde oxidase GLOX-like n=1 Tax=Impatiens glandulifera TaxID=253017 RepID=UPI001FB18462|nr:aldehyde oxidase GLOX-like [Impatiens glandulifera]